MNWAKLFLLCLCGNLIVDRHVVLGQMCNEGETLRVTNVLCGAMCIPALSTIMGRFLSGTATGMCMVSLVNGEITVTGANLMESCSAIIRTCTTDPTSVATTTTTTTAATTTTTAVAVDSSESSEGGSSSRRR